MALVLVLRLQMVEGQPSYSHGIIIFCRELDSRSKSLGRIEASAYRVREWRD